MYKPLYGTKTSRSNQKLIMMDEVNFRFDKGERAVKMKGLAKKLMTPGKKK